jgi:hypothetical protein
MDPLARRGRNQLLVAVISMVAALLLIALAVWLRGAEFRPATEVGRPIVFAVLGYFAFHRAKWARILLAVWSGLLALTFAIVAVTAGFVSILWAGISLAFAVGAVYVTYMVATSDAIDAFVGERAGRSNVSRPAA